MADTAMLRKAKGKQEIIYGDLFLSKIDKGIHVSSLVISSVVARIHEHSLDT